MKRQRDAHEREVARVSVGPWYEYATHSPMADRVQDRLRTSS